jgi:hypothetical protein
MTQTSPEAEVQQSTVVSQTTPNALETTTANAPARHAQPTRSATAASSPTTTSGPRSADFTSAFEGASTSPPATVAQSFATWIARIAANEDEPATKAQVHALASAFHASCSAPRDGQYPCVIHQPTQTPIAAQACTAIADSSGRTLWGRCRGDNGPAPIITPGYVDCSTVAHSVSISDPADDRDETDSLAPGPPVGGTPADLLAIKVAATSTQFCADVKTARPLRSGTTLEFRVMPSAPRPDDDFSPAIDFRYARGLDVMDSNSDIPAQVGQEGQWTSLLITNPGLGTSETRVLAPPFTISALAEYGAGSSVQHRRPFYTDTSGQLSYR